MKYYIGTENHYLYKELFFIKITTNVKVSKNLLQVYNYHWRISGISQRYITIFLKRLHEDASKIIG